MAELMNGHKISQDCESDIYTMLVPVEETEWVQPDSRLTAKEGDVIFKYVLSSRDYFDSDQLYEGDIAAISRANSLTTCESDPNRISITCTSENCILDTTQ